MFIKFAHVTHRMNIMEWHTIVIYREMLKLTIVEITKARSYQSKKIKLATANIHVIIIIICIT